LTDESGTDIGRYHLLAKLGEGGMGSVYVAEHKLMRKRVAVKMMHSAIGANSAPLVRFINEARAAARIHHPGVIEIFDCDFDNRGRVYQAMELLRGESLRDFLERHGPLSAHPQLLRRIGRDVAVAVGAAHAAGIIHRDLKPDNLFLSVHADGSSAVDVKVLDFGIAKLNAELGFSNADVTQAGARIGSILYMAPEQAVDAGRVDGRADIYALGCILYEMVAGRTPLSESDGLAVLAARLTRAPQPLRELAPDVDSSLEAMVMSFLARDPADRPHDMSAVAAALAQDLEPATLTRPITLPVGLRVDVPDHAPNPRPHGKVVPLGLPHAAAATRLRQEEPEPDGADRDRVRLPAQPTSFVGREGELAEARQLFGRTRLLTLVGPGGIGKTRLALELAAQVSGEFPGGVTFVPLASITDPELVAPAIVESLELEPGPVPARERLLRHFAGRTALLVLDNFEQVLGAAPLVSALIRECPALKLVVSSRACLSISGEQEMPVPPLELPDSNVAADEVSNFESVRLFIARVLATKPSFEITPDSVAAIAEICVRLDGLPLAIELAAAWAKLIPPTAILDRLRRRLDLRSSARDIPARQRTIRATIDWSHDLLDDAAKRLFARLAVFCGATLDDVEAVCADGPDANLLDALGTLVEHSLVRQQDEADGSRFTMLETIREYALERLAVGPDEESVRRRHALRYLALAEDARPHLVRVERQGWLARLEREHDNLRAAFDTCMTSGRIEEALRLVAALWRFWQFRGHYREGRQRVERALADPGSKAHPRARELAVDGAGGLAYWLGDMSAMAAFYEECLELARANGDPIRISNALYNVSFRWVAGTSGVEERARKIDLCISEGLTLARGAGDRAGIARCLWVRAVVATHLRSDDVAALKLLAEAITLFREEGDLFGLAWALHSEGMAHLRARDLARAGAALREAVSLLGEARDPMGAAIILGDEAKLALACADRVRAVRLAGASAALRHLTGSELGSFVDEIEGRAVQATDADLATWNEGLAMTFDDAIAYALERIG